MSLRRGIGLGIAIGIAAFALSGCVTFKGQIKGKQVSDNKVQVKFKVCAGSNGECSEPKPRARGMEEAHLLVGYRVPRGTEVPLTIRPANSDEELKRNGRYTFQLNQKAPKRDGQKWFGFASTPLEKDDVAEPSRIKVRFGLPDDIGKVFKYRPVVGLAVDPPGDTAPDCGPDLYKDDEMVESEDACIADPESARKTRRSLRIKLD